MDSLSIYKAFINNEFLPKYIFSTIWAYGKVFKAGF